MTALVLGPLLRYVGETEAVLWVETDAPCEVEVLGTRERSFQIDGHHYALVTVRGLTPATGYDYEVLLDGERVWPLAGSEFPASGFRTPPKEGEARVAFGSCRVAAPHEPPYSLRKDQDERGREIDALRTLACACATSRDERLAGPPPAARGPGVRRRGVPRHASFAETRRHPDEPPGRRVLDYEEYTRLYREAGPSPPSAGCCPPCPRR